MTVQTEVQVQISRRLFTVNEFKRMLEAGILTEDERVELIEGEVCKMSPVGSQHAACVKRLNAILSRLLGTTVIISVQDPIRLTDYTEPLPDLAVLRPQADFYAHEHPGPEAVLLLIEVAETSFAYDRNEKLPRYAEAGIPEVWLVDLAGETIIQSANPQGRRYTTTTQVKQGQMIQSTRLPQLQIEAAEILG